MTTTANALQPRALQPRPVRSRAPLSLEQIQQAAPSAFATEPWERVSDRYTFIPTVNVIRGLLDSGFQAFAASQSRTRVAGKQNFTKHMIRFRQPGESLTTVGDTVPEIVLINGHDRSTRYKLMAGIFRLVCSNGMIVSDAMISTVSIRHSGDVIEEVVRQSHELTAHLPRALDAISQWRGIDLTHDEQLTFGEAAATLRFGDKEGLISAGAPGAEQLIQARRPIDQGNDLWSTFNRVQENVIKGGLVARTASNQRRRTRQIKGIDQDVRLNRALWTLGERFAELKAA